MAFSVLVYVIPTLSEQSIFGSYDAFAYAEGMVEEADIARQLQPFLGAYPTGLSRSALPIYAIGLHFALIAPSLILGFKSMGRRNLVTLLCALAVPESAIFLGAVSKEGLAIAAVVAALAGQAAHFGHRPLIGLFLNIYAVGIAEYSRPGFGFPFAAALIFSYLPCVPAAFRSALTCTFVFTLALGIWTILAGPFKDQFSDAYQAAKIFLLWFEDNMGSDSALKSGIRYFFSLAFGSENPSLFFLLIVSVMATLKAAVYFFAIPIISPANFTEMPAQTWALTWQVASSISTIVMMFSAWKIYQLRSSFTVPEKVSLWFGFSLLFLISISTAIFHVRYRAPAVVAILAALWTIKRSRTALISMTLPSLTAAAFSILTT